MFLNFKINIKISLNCFLKWKEGLKVCSLDRIDPMSDGKGIKVEGNCV